MTVVASGINAGQTSRLANAAGHIVAFAANEAVGIDNRYHRDAVCITQADEPRRLCRSMVVDRPLGGGNHANRCTIDSGQRRINRLAIAGVKLHGAVRISQRRYGVSRVIL